MQDSNKQIKSWIRSQHLICAGTDFIFETVDQTQLEKFERCIEEIGGRVRSVKAVGNWPMGQTDHLKFSEQLPVYQGLGAKNWLHTGQKKGAIKLGILKSTPDSIFKPPQPCWF